MKQKNPQDKAPAIHQMEAKDGVDVIRLIANVGGHCFAVPLHYDEGDRCYGLPTVVSFLLMVALIEWAPPLAFYLPVWSLMLIGKRLRRSGQQSYFGGWSRLRRIFRNEKLARTMEPFFVFALGVAFAPFSEPFAEFCIFGAICLFVVLAMEMHQISEMKRQIRDNKAMMDFQGRLSRGETGW